MKSLCDQVLGYPIRQVGGAACIKERHVYAIAEAGDREIARLKKLLAAKKRLVAKKGKCR